VRRNSHQVGKPIGFPLGATNANKEKKERGKLSCRLWDEGGRGV